MSTEGLHSGNKLKEALFSLPMGIPVTTRLMEAWGISRQLVHQYVKSGWLEPLGGSYYRRPGDEISRDGALTALNAQGMQAHIGGKSALKEHGVTHYLVLGSQKLYLYSSRRRNLPSWFKEQFSCEFRTNRLFGEEGDTGSRLQVRRRDAGTESPYVSAPERAVLEMLDEVPDRQSRDEAAKLMEPLFTLRPDVLQELLEACTRIKVKRLFFALAKEQNLPVLKELDRSRIDFGAESDYIRSIKGNSLILKHPGKQADA